MASATTTNFAHHLKIPLHEVLEATNNFDRNNIIGHGGLGVAYKGQLSRSGELMKIAALRLHPNQGKDVEFWTEISVLSDLKHTNLVSIIGFCDEENEKIIVFTRAAKGSLKEHLDSSNLTWTQRLRICLGMARAMRYLHHEEGRDYGVTHRNINSTTVLLDENWEAKLSDFKVSIKQSANRITDQVLIPGDPIGTIGYMDPQIETTGGVTHKSDIYAFGVVLFEVVCGRKAYIKDDANSTFLLRGGGVYRPDARKVVEELEKALELQLWLENLGNNLQHLKISLSDIKLATCNFSASCRFGSNDNIEFYEARLDHFGKEEPHSVEMKSKGELPKNNDTVIIKRFLITDVEQEEELFSTELELLTGVKHHNIVTLVGFCVEGFERVLVTESFSKGYLSSYLGTVEHMSILTWEKRLKICIDVAHALHYLHFNMEDKKVIIHGWINSWSIGFKENWRAKIDEFAYGGFLATNQEDKVPRKKSISYVIYYVDPDYVKELNDSLKFKRESGVYSFGVVLFEILCGRKANDPIYLNESDKGLAIVAKRTFCTGTLDDMIDPLLKGESDGNNSILDNGPNKDSFDTFCKIAYSCVANTQDKRPTMKVVVKELEKSLFFQENKKKNLRMSLEDIRLATQNFHDENCIGGGSFGKVYRGKVPQGDGFYSIVAKRLDTRLGQGEQQFFNELQILMEHKHDKIINLVGYCDEKDEKVIVYEYSSGSLEGHLNDASLTWMKRLNICIDVASALDFLHEGIGRDAKMLIHGDIKSANIYLNDDWKAKLAGFGFSLRSPLNQETNYLTNHECGTLWYLDPLYIKIKILNQESDVYSFGVVLFEILCGRSTLAIHEHEGHCLPDFVRNNFEEGKHEELVFEQIEEQIKRKSLDTFQTIAYQCLHPEKEKRPTTKDILMQLKKALEFQVSNHGFTTKVGFL
ncbi:uncharacterized protein LOC143571392 [Bidens hawaiensis]|uniref:uncharacterized protein LOC143571392 n=1 Tax=Bidens hawaiensis TaxID=980011 RepID=UPI00404B6936